MRISNEILEQYQIISKLGEGGYGIVYKAREKGTNNIVTIKKTKKIDQDNEAKLPISITNEIDILNQLKGLSNIIKLKEILNDKLNDCVYMIYDYYEYDINDLINKYDTLSVEQIKSYFKQMLISLKNVHSKGYIHQDIKPSNFLVSSNNEIKLIDFGLSKKINNENIISQNKINIVGTLKYIAPEIILGKADYGKEADIWSLGLTFYEMLTKESLFCHCQTTEEIANRIVKIFGIPDKSEWPEFYDLPNKNLFLNNRKYANLSSESFFKNKIPKKYKQFENLISDMIQLNPEKRITVEEALKYPVFDDSKISQELPLINISETYFQKSNVNKITKEDENIKNLYDELRPKKIIPHII